MNAGSMHDGEARRAAGGVTAIGLLAFALLTCAFPRAGRAADPALEHVRDEACLDDLKRTANVTVEFYDRAGKRSWGGDAVWRLDQRHYFTYTYRSFDRGDSMDVVFDVKASLEILPVHTVHLPRGLNDSTAWYQRLRHHEFDHVAISSDERLHLLARWLVANMPPVTRRVPRGTPIGSGLANQAIGEEVERRFRAVVNLLQAQENRLDSLTEHGVLPLADRAAFFDSLYGRTGLQRAHFAYLLEVGSLLDAPRYTNAPRPRCDWAP